MRGILFDLAMRMPKEAIERLLDTWPVARLATITPEGRPHQVPVVFARVRERLWSPIDAKPKQAGELARVRHLRANPAASLLLDDYAEDWSRLWWLRVDVTARVVEPDTPDADPIAAAAVAALRAKYPQYERVEVLREPAVLLELSPVRVASWCAGREAIPIG
jgi:PPOX class probable F420-dependent enzyme